MNEEEKSLIENHDINARGEDRTFKIVIMCDDYKLTLYETVSNDCLGLDDLDYVLERIIEGMYPSANALHPHGFLTLVNASGGTLQISDECERHTDWLVKHVVSASLVEEEYVGGELVSNR